MSGTSVAVFEGCGDTVPLADSVGAGVAVGGHDRTVPRGGHGESDEYQENTLAAPCTLDTNISSLPFDWKTKSWTRGSLVSSDGRQISRDSDRIGHIRPTRNGNATL